MEIPLPGPIAPRSERPAPGVQARNGLRQLLRPHANGREEPVSLDRLHHAEQCYRALFDGLPIGLFRYSLETRRMLDVNPALVGMLGFEDREVLLQTPLDEILDEPLETILTRSALSGPGDPVEVAVRRPDGRLVWLRVRVGLQIPLPGAMTIVDGVVEDVTPLHESVELQLRFRHFFEMAEVGMLIVDVEGQIESVNPALCRMTGYATDEIVGRSLDDFVHPEERGEDRAALAGSVVDPDFGSYSVERRLVRRDGQTVWCHAVGALVKDAAGQPLFALAMLHDLTAIKSVEQRLAAEHAEREDVMAALSSLVPRATLELTAADIAQTVMTIEGVDMAAVLDLTNEHAVALALIAPPEAPAHVGETLPPDRTQYLQERAARGPWTALWDRARTDYQRAWVAAGMQASAYLPLTYGERVVGLIIAGSSTADDAESADRWLKSLADYGPLASALLGPDLLARATLERQREALRSVIAEHQFATVFQPIVRLKDSIIVGYEALTRFHDGTPPDARLRQAADIGMRLELEEACLAAALDAAGRLPRGPWLSVNVSPLLMRDPKRLRRHVTRRHLVLEVTEDEAIDDYSAIRACLARLGDVDLAIDDAGAGYAGLRHIVELRPRYLKFDRRMVEHIDHDPSRQAMAAGLVHFAARTGCALIAEGIESEGERRAVEALGVDLGQGFLLGRPAPPEVVAGRDGTATVARSEPSAHPRRSLPPVDQSDLAAGLRGEDGHEQLAFPYDLG
jgi:PAS domain S-box-containing protein